MLVNDIHDSYNDYNDPTMFPAMIKFQLQHFDFEDNTSDWAYYQF